MKCLSGCNSFRIMRVWSRLSFHPPLGATGSIEKGKSRVSIEAAKAGTLARSAPATMERATRRLLRFSVFEIDLDAGELFKRGQKLKLQGQPFQLLVELLENQGRVVTREHLKDRLWPGATAGDFDSSLNRAINRIREVLNDSAERPLFIETLPRRGYRFLQTVSDGSAVESAPTVVTGGVDQEAHHPRAKRAWRWGAAAGVSFVIVFFVLRLMTHGAATTRPDLKMRQITTNSSENPVSGAVISPDGKYLAYADPTGMRLQEIATGETHALPKPKSLSAEDAWFPSAWFPDGTRLVATAIKPAAQGQVISSVWSVPVLGNPILLRDNAFAPAVSRDGTMIAFTREPSGCNGPLMAFELPWTSEIWVMGPNGENPKKLLATDGQPVFRSLQWSPDVSRIAYIGIHLNGQSPFAPFIGTITLRGRQTSVILPDFLGSEFSWLPNGRIIYTRAEPAPNNLFTNLWELEIDSRTGTPKGRPHPLTSLPGFNMSNLSVSSDGQKVAVKKNSYRSDIYIGSLKTNGQLGMVRRLTFDERSNMPTDWTADSKSVIFASDRTGVTAIYRQDVDQSLAELIPTGPQEVWLPRVTPDGSSILYQANPDIEHPSSSPTIRLMRVPVSGGARELVLEFPSENSDLDCPKRRGAVCIIQVGTAFFAFDPLTGKRRELFRREGEYNWTMSPDGSHIAELRGNAVHIISLTGRVERTIEVKGWPYMATIDWAADGKSVLVSHSGRTRATLLRVRLNGQIEPIWEMQNALSTWAVASPDGRYLAIMGASLNSNVWLLENF